MNEHQYNKQWDKHMRRTHRSGFPGLDLRGHTLREIRRRMRGIERNDDANEADGEELNAK